MEEKYCKSILITGVPNPNEIADDIEVEFLFEKIITYPSVDNEKPNRANIFNSMLQEKEKYSPKEKDRLYFYPKCTVARYKVRSWGEKSKSRVTVKKETATAKFINEDTFEDFIHQMKSTSINREIFIKWVKANYKEEKENDSVISIIKHLEECNSERIFVDKEIIGDRVNIRSESCTSHMKSFGFNRSLSEFSTKDIPFASLNSYDACSTIEEFKELTLIAEDKLVFHQQDIIDIVNEDSLVIDNEMLEELDAMFSNEEHSNHLLALEIISNCNYSPSLYPLLSLISKYHEKIIGMKEVDHVNFKGVLSYLGIGKYDMKISNENMLDILIEKKALTPSILADFAEIAKESMKENITFKYFDLKTITVKDNIKEYFLNLQEEKLKQDGNKDNGVK